MSQLTTMAPLPVMTGGVQNLDRGRIDNSVRQELNTALREQGHSFRYVLGNQDMQDPELLNDILVHGKDFALTIDPQQSHVALSPRDKAQGKLQLASEVQFKGTAPVKVWLEETHAPVWLFPVAFANDGPRKARKTDGYTLCSGSGCQNLEALKALHKNPVKGSGQSAAGGAGKKLSPARRQHQLRAHWMDSAIHNSRFSWGNFPVATAA